MLAFAPRTAYVDEPFNPKTPAGLSGGRFERYFEYVTADNEAAFRPSLERTLGFRYDVRAARGSLSSARDAAVMVRDYAHCAQARLRRARPLMKDPIAVFSAEWLANTFSMDVVILIRHPAAFVASFKRLGWRHRFASFLEQPRLMSEHLSSFQPEIRACANGTSDQVGEAILLWKLVHHVIATYEDRHPTWIFRRHEDLSREPVTEYATIYLQLGLEFTPRARAAIAKHSSPANPLELRSAHDITLASSESLRNWTRILTADEVSRVRSELEDVAVRYYADDDW
jgi:hypothetical protein